MTLKFNKYIKKVDWLARRIKTYCLASYRLDLVQLDFLKRQGLESGNTLLDVGCGVLDSGVRFIEYLEASKYTGIDISNETINVALELVENLGLKRKQPVLFRNNDLRFKEFRCCFDFIWVHSVFTHLESIYIEEFFRNVGNIMHSNTKVLFTYVESEVNYSTSQIMFGEFYSKKYFNQLAVKFGFSLIDLTSDFHHPMKKIRNLRIVRLENKKEGI